MKRLSSFAALWIIIAVALACAGCRPSQPAPASENKAPAQPEPAKTEMKVLTPAPAAAEPAPAAASSEKLPALTEPAKAASPVPAVAPAPALAPETILVKVNDKSIAQGDLDKETKSVEKMMLQRGLSPQQFASMLATFKPQILDGLVTQALIDNECAARKIAITDDDVKAKIDTIKASLPKNVALEEVLAQKRMTLSVLEEQIKDQLTMEKLLNVTVSDADAQEFYDDNKARIFETVSARHILIKTDLTDDAAKKAVKKEKAEKLRKQIVDGADFAKLAKENSDCPSKEFGGELKPPFRRGQMVKPFETAAFSLKTNEISQVVETDSGYHIIQTLERRFQPFDEVKDRIMAMLTDGKIQQGAEPYIKSLKAKTKIEYLNGATPPPPPETMFPAGAFDDEPTDVKAVVKPAEKAADQPATPPESLKPPESVKPPESPKLPESSDSMVKPAETDAKPAK